MDCRMVTFATDTPGTGCTPPESALAVREDEGAESATTRAGRSRYRKHLGGAVSPVGRHWHSRGLVRCDQNNAGRRAGDRRSRNAAGVLRRNRARWPRLRHRPRHRQGDRPLAAVVHWAFNARCARSTTRRLTWQHFPSDHPRRPCGDSPISFKPSVLFDFLFKLRGIA